MTIRVTASIFFGLQQKVCAMPLTQRWHYPSDKMIAMARRLLDTKAHDFSPIQSNPRIVPLRNPEWDPTLYDRLRDDPKFGRHTTPSSQDPPWPAEFRCLLKQALAPPGTECVSMTIMQYRGVPKRYQLGFHKDPAAYNHIVSVTLQGQGIMHLRKARGVTQTYPLQQGMAVILEQEECWQAKHAVEGRDDRLAIIIRFSPSFFLPRKQS